ncbi:hypothetical protein I553_5385 [Mycobacterium xenopi 4042]|uniref:Uncharacterized protein n=1 Tax=Mycobacterium xenopi 4042 TaxID=1299334 RepID=X7ZWC5_MYCXE|nr:hypothetical protein I553_5385 [Mycobacterium xenopi 4042]
MVQPHGALRDGNKTWPYLGHCVVATASCRIRNDVSRVSPPQTSIPARVAQSWQSRSCDGDPIRW